jgi:hypothetical protein
VAAHEALEELTTAAWASVVALFMAVMLAMATVSCGLALGAKAGLAFGKSCFCVFSETFFSKHGCSPESVRYIS